MSSLEQQKQSREKVEIRAVGWIKGSKSRWGRKAPVTKQRVEGATEGVGKNNQEDGEREEQQTARGVGRLKRN